MLAFADSRQEAAFFAWYAEESYKKLRDRNLMLRAINAGPVDEEGLSIDDLRNRLLRQWEQAGLFSKADTREQRDRQVLTSILREAVTDEKRLSLSGVGLVKWFRVYAFREFRNAYAQVLREGYFTRFRVSTLVPISFYPILLQLFNGRCHVLVPARIIDGWSFEPEF